MKIVKLDPKTWDRGRSGWQERGEPGVNLLGEKGMCCMGFAAMAFGATVEQIKFVSTWLYCTNPELKARDEESEGWSEHRFARLYEMNDDTSGQTDRERIDQLNEILEELGEDFRFELASEPKMDKAVHEWYGTHPGSTSTPPASSNTAPLISALTECVACLERYCGPGTRGHEARKKARELLKGLGVDLES